MLNRQVVIDKVERQKYKTLVLVLASQAGMQGKYNLVQTSYFFRLSMVIINLIVLSKMIFIFDMSATLIVQLATIKEQLCMSNLLQIRG